MSDDRYANWNNESSRSPVLLKDELTALEMVIAVQRAIRADG